MKALGAEALRAIACSPIFSFPSYTIARYIWDGSCSVCLCSREIKMSRVSMSTCIGHVAWIRNKLLWFEARQQSWGFFYCYKIWSIQTNMKIGQALKWHFKRMIIYMGKSSLYIIILYKPAAYKAGIYYVILNLSKQASTQTYILEGNISEC